MGIHVKNTSFLQLFSSVREKWILARDPGKKLGFQSLGFNSNRHYTAGNLSSKRCCGEHRKFKLHS